MDIEQMKKYYKNKINAENLTKKVRDTIKLVDWKKQDMREGFTESFSPLIKSQESIKKSIDDQQNATIAQLRANQLALTDKENKLGELITAMLSITDGKDNDAITGDTTVTPSDDTTVTPSDDTTVTPSDDTTVTPSDDKTKKIITIIPDYFDQNLNNKFTVDILNKYNIENLPSSYFFKPQEYILKKVKLLANMINDFKTKELQNIALFKQSPEGYITAEPKNVNPRQKTKDLIQDYNVLTKYFFQINQLYKFKKTQSGKGVGIGGLHPPYDPPAINNYKTPSQLVDRLELLAGSISAGNNGVINEFSQIAHLLAQMSVITKKQLNKLLKWGLSLN